MSYSFVAMSRPVMCTVCNHMLNHEPILDPILTLPSSSNCMHTRVFPENHTCCLTTALSHTNTIQYSRLFMRPLSPSTLLSSSISVHSFSSSKIIDNPFWLMHFYKCIKGFCAFFLCHEFNLSRLYVSSFSYKKWANTKTINNFRCILVQHTFTTALLFSSSSHQSYSLAFFLTL